MTAETVTTNPPEEEDSWTIIHEYSRADALADGVLIDITETTREAGIGIPVAVTEALWREYVALTPAAKRAGNDERGRLRDIATMLRLGALQNRRTSEFLFDVLVVTDSVRPSPVTLKAMCHPGDAGEPVITVLLPHED